MCMVRSPKIYWWSGRSCIWGTHPTAIAIALQIIFLASEIPFSSPLQWGCYTRPSLCVSNKNTAKVEAARTASFACREPKPFAFESLPCPVP